MITSSSDLQHLIDGKRAPADFVLAPGEYHVHGTDQGLELSLSAFPRYGTNVYVHETPLIVGDNSEIKKISWHAADDIAIFKCDRSSRAQIHHNFLNGPRAWDGRGMVADFERSGYGILATDESNSESNWACEFYSNEFRWFRAGIEARMPGVSPIGDRIKGTSKWQLINNGFDGCLFGLHLIRPELFRIVANHFQLHELGIWIEGGHTCWLTDNDFERGQGPLDIAYDDATCYMLAVGNSPSPQRVSKDVKNRKRHNVYARYLRKLNIWAPCDKGEIG